MTYARGDWSYLYLHHDQEEPKRYRNDRRNMQHEADENLLTSKNLHLLQVIKVVSQLLNCPVPQPPIMAEHPLKIPARNMIVSNIQSLLIVSLSNSQFPLASISQP